MAESEGEPAPEDEFRERYSQDPAGATFDEINRLYALVQQLDRRITEITNILRQIAPELMTLRDIRNEQVRQAVEESEE